MKKILILQPHEDQARAIAKFLKSYSQEFFIVGGIFGDSEDTQSIPYFDKLEKVSADFVFEEKNYDIIVPTASFSTNAILSTRDSIRIGNISFDRNNIQVFDKLPFLDKVEKLQIPIPKTYKNFGEIHEFPVFYKQRYEKGGGSRGIIRSKAELKALSGDKSIFFQEFIDSVGNYDVGFLAKDGIIITMFMHRALYNWPKPGGSAVVLTELYNKKILEYSSIILKNMKYSGWGLIQFKYCHKRKDFVFMEVNAKFWASIEFAFLNNPVFLKELFGIHYEPKKVRCIVFCNRLANYGFIEYTKLMLRYSSCYKLFFPESIKKLFLNLAPVDVKKNHSVLEKMGKK